MRDLATKLGEACYWLNLIELLALTGVTYVSNRENYCKIPTLDVFIYIKIQILIRCKLFENLN